LSASTTSPYAAHVQAIAEQGYTLVERAVDPGTVSRLLALIREHYARAEKPSQTAVPYLNRGHEVLYNLQNRDVLFIRAMINHPAVRTVMMAHLNDTWYKQIPQDRPNYILRSMLARSGGAQPLPLHIDSFIPGSGSFAWSLQASFVLEDQHPENGCTVVVPGTHRADRYADQESMARAAPIASKAGDILIWDSRLWHGTTGNQSGRTRWAFIATFGRWWLKQNYDIPRALPRAIYNELNDEERAVMGYCSQTPRDEFERIDIKGGYELLRAADELHRASAAATTVRAA
jgi:ectoine hydroxylase-related dioxygenase (phytanoyl-CoA dioxygenase family)